MSPRQLRRQRARFRRTSGPRCFLLILCFLLAACGGIHTASTPPAAGATSDTLTERDLPSPTADNPGSLSSVPSQPFAGSAPVAPEPAQPMPPSVAAPAGQVENLAGNVAGNPAGNVAGNGAVAPAWRPLAERLAADGLAGPRVDVLLSTLAARPS